MDLGGTCAPGRTLPVPLRARPREVFLAAPRRPPTAFRAWGTEAERPRSVTPCFCNRRYNEESPIPNRVRSSAGDAFSSVYTRAISRCSSGVSLGRRLRAVVPSVVWSAMLNSAFFPIRLSDVRVIYFSHAMIAQIVTETDSAGSDQTIQRYFRRSRRSVVSYIPHAQLDTLATGSHGG